MFNRDANRVLNTARRFCYRCGRYDMYNAHKSELIKVCRDSEELEYYSKKLAEIMNV